MRIAEKELDISIYLKGLQCKAKCTAVGYGSIPSNTPYINVKKHTLRQLGHDSIGTKRTHSSGIFISTGYGPVLYSTNTPHVSLNLKYISVKRINNRKIEDYFGINLEKWSLEALYLRFSNEIFKVPPSFTAHHHYKAPENVEKFVERLRRIREFRFKQKKIFQDKQELYVNHLINICDRF